MAKKKNVKRNGRVASNMIHLLEARTHFMQELLKKGFSKKDLAFIFNLHPSQITRSLKI